MIDEILTEHNDFFSVKAPQDKLSPSNQKFRIRSTANKETNSKHL